MFLFSNIFIEDGGTAFIKANDISQSPDFFPVNSLTITSQTRWKFAIAHEKDLRSGAHPLLAHDDSILLTQGTFGKGSIILSGLNLPYHIVAYQNFEEAKLFRNSMTYLVGNQKIERPTFNVERPIDIHCSLYPLPSPIPLFGKNSSQFISQISI